MYIWWIDDHEWANMNCSGSFGGRAKHIQVLSIPFVQVHTVLPVFYRLRHWTPASCFLQRHCFTLDNNDNASPTLVADIAVASIQAPPRILARQGFGGVKKRAVSLCVGAHIRSFVQTTLQMITLPFLSLTDRLHILHWWLSETLRKADYCRPFICSNQQDVVQ